MAGSLNLSISSGPDRVLDLYSFAAEGVTYLPGRQVNFNNYDGVIVQGGPVTLYGLGRADVVVLTGQSDTFYGGNGADSAAGFNGDDVLFGENGDDRLFGDSGNDVLYGGAGNDVLGDTAGNDSIYGGDGNDVAQGHIGNDSIYGGDGVDQLFGGDGNDYVVGGAGNDSLEGGAGRDRVTGASGKDDLWGGDGNDVFDWNDPTESRPLSYDVVRDYRKGDRLDVSSIDADSGTSRNDTFEFIGSRGFSGDGDGGELRAVRGSTSTTIAADINGDGEADFMAKLVGGFTLTAADLIL